MNFINYSKIFIKTLNGWSGHSILFAAIFSLVPTVFWLWFWLQEDEDKPEPARMILKTFVVGGFSVVAAFCLERLVTFNPEIGKDFQTSLSVNGPRAALVMLWPIATWAFFEEAVKYLAAYVAAFRKSHFDEPVDAMIYMITAALGFAAVENFLFLLSSVLDNGIIGSSFIFTSNLRFLGATLLHVVTSATLGAFIGFSFYKNTSIKKGSLVLGLLVATILHTLYNFFIIIDEGKNIFGVLVFLWLITSVIIFIFEIVKKVSAKHLPSNL